MPSRATVTPTKDPFQYYYYSSSAAPASNDYNTSSAEPASTDYNTYASSTSCIYTIDSAAELNNSGFLKDKWKSGASPPFMHQAAGADFQPLGHRSTIVDCYDCGSQMPSRVFYEIGMKTHLSALIACLLGLWCCAPLPYFINHFKTSSHYCGNCDHYLGSYPLKTLSN